MRRFLELDEFAHLQRSVVELSDVCELNKVFSWTLAPVLDDPSIHEFEYVTDVNERRIRDAEILGTVVRNVNPKVCLDIGTSTGHSAALLAVNAPEATIYTVNIPPEEFADGGVHTTIKLEEK